MFSSNQILEISGYLRTSEIKRCLNFGLEVYGTNLHFNELCFQITSDNKYCIGYCSKDTEAPKNWIKYNKDLLPFEDNMDITDIIALIIEKYLSKQEIKEDIWDGGYHKGFIMKAIEETFAMEYNNIINPKRGILTFEAFTTFYSK